MQLRPKDMDKDKWQELWNNSHPQLQPLADLLKEWVAVPDAVRPDDFDCPNHYAKMVAQSAKRQALLDVLNLLPDTVSK